MFFETIVDFVNRSRKIVKVGGRGSKKNAEALCHDIIGVHMLSPEMQEEDKDKDKDKDAVASTLCTLYPYNHPERFTPIGLTTMAYIIQAAVDEKFSGRKSLCTKGENPFDYVSGSGIELLCSPENKGLTTCIVQRALNMMCTSTGKAKHHTLIHILSQCSVEQGRLLCEMMACTLTFGMGIKRFIENLGKCEKDSDAVNAALTTLYMTNNLNKVASAIISREPAPLEVGYYISSMLARQKAFHDPIEAFDFIVNEKNNGFSGKGKRKRADKDEEKEKEDVKFKEETEEEAEDEEAEYGSFIAQIKIDGYRIQLHRKAGQVNRTWYFSRQGLNLAETYHFNVLDEHIIQSMDSMGCQDFILDGEVIALNKKTNEFVPCSDMAAYPWLKNDDVILVYFVFDIMYMDGKVYLKEPYSYRLNAIKKLVKQSDHIIPMIEGVTKPFQVAKTINSRKAVLSYYDDIVNKLDLEGIMIKSLDSLWTPYARSNAHVKIKPSPASYDLYIVGANVNRAQLISSVLLAYKSEENDQYYAMTMCGTGLTARARARLTEWFFERNRSSTRGGNHVPSYLHVSGGSDKPHMYLCDTPIIARVTAQKMTDSKVYATGKTLRFPVLRCIPEIQFDAYASYSYANGTKSYKSESETAMPIETGFVTQENDILKDQNVWIVPTKDESLFSELVRHVLRMSGTYDKEPTLHTMFAVVPDLKHDEQTLLVAQKEYPDIKVVSADWLRNCFLWNTMKSFENFKMT